MAKKTDNHNPKAKLDLRRYFLKKYHADGQPIRVFDCCQGSGLLWRELRKEFDVASYWGVDVKPKAGRLKIESQRVLAQTGMTENVIDIDTYGSPWKHWAVLLPNITQPITVFLTIGQVSFSGSALHREAREALGIGNFKVPNAIGCKLNCLAANYLLSYVRSGTTILEAVEAVSDGNARYIGVRLEPMNANGPQFVPASRSEPTHVEKGQ